MAAKVVCFTCQNCQKCVLVNHNGKEYKALFEGIVLIVFSYCRNEKC